MSTKLLSKVFLVNTILAIFIQTIVADDVYANILQYKKAEMISSKATHENCTILQGYMLTMLGCPTSYEVYNTPAIALDPYDQPLRGEITQQILSPKTDRETGMQDRLTFVQNGNMVISVYWDEEAQDIKKEKIAELAGIPTTISFKNVWVFDTVIITQLENSYMTVYEKPVVGGLQQIPVVMDYNNLRYDESMLASDFAVSITDPYLFELYAVNKGLVEKYVFNYAATEQIMHFQTNMSSPYSPFDGELYDIVVSAQHIVISCSDCFEPQIAFFNKYSLALVYTIAMPKLSFEKYDLALYQASSNAYDVAIGGRTTVSTIRYQYKSNNDGAHTWEFNENTWILDATSNSMLPVNETHQISIGRSADYISFKVQSHPNIYMIAACQNGYYFDEGSFKCGSCRSAHRSFGVQTPECMPCNYMSFAAGTDYQEAVAYDMCETGLMTSYLLIFFIIFGLCSSGGLMCHIEFKNGLKDDLKRQKLARMKKVEQLQAEQDALNDIENSKTDIELADANVEGADNEGQGVGTAAASDENNRGTFGNNRQPDSDFASDESDSAQIEDSMKDITAEVDQRKQAVSTQLKNMGTQGEAALSNFGGKN